MGACVPFLAAYSTYGPAARSFTSGFRAVLSEGLSKAVRHCEALVVDDTING